jgi:cytochrome c oxidase subunit 2
LVRAVTKSRAAVHSQTLEKKMVTAANMTAGDGSLGYFLGASGPAARPTLWLDWGFAGVSVAVCLLIAGLLLFSLYRRRADGEAIVHDTAGVRWVMVGAGLSAGILLVMAVAAFAALMAVAAPPRPASLVIAVTGYDWWWKADYGDFATANELHIPTGVPVYIRLQSADVIHAFWVPQLAGKTQMIPGVSTHQWLQADRPGIYRGQCTQFCGVQHAHMAFEVVAQSPADFARWRASQAGAAIPPVTADAMAGQVVFQGRCGGCHTVRGMVAKGEHGPDLTHLMSRRTIAAGLIETTPDTVMDWVVHAQERKPGARMPDTNLSPTDAAALRAYLSGLR